MNPSQEGSLAEVNLNFVVSPLIIRGGKKPAMICVHCWGIEHSIVQVMS